MPELEAVYDSQDGIPEQYRDLYEERGGKFMLTGIKGVKTEADIQRVQRALDQEKEAHKEVKSRLSAWGDLDPTETLPKLDRIPELEAAAAGKIDDEKMEELVSARVRSTMAPVERENKQLKETLSEREARIETFEAKERERTIHDAVREAATKAKVVQHAIDDVLILSDRMFEIDADGKVVTRDGVGVTPGINAEVWLQEMQDRRPHWWPPSQGGGAGGDTGAHGFSENPFSAEHWNLTRQGQVLNTKGREVADQMAKAAGTTVGGPRPSPKDKK